MLRERNGAKTHQQKVYRTTVISRRPTRQRVVNGNRNSEHRFPLLSVPMFYQIPEGQTSLYDESVGSVRHVLSL